MKRKKLLICGILFLLLAGCGKSEDTAMEPDNGEQLTETQEPTEEPVEEQETGFVATGHYTDNAEMIANAKELLGDTQYYYLDSEQGQDALALLESRIEEIENTSSYEFVKSDEFILGETYTGNEYYVDAENGNDDNDGRTPETAWKTINRSIAGDTLKFGDIVYLKRGCIYYQTTHEVPNGITYAAYGEGDKPVVTGCPEYVNDPTKWELYYEEDGKQIWHIRMEDCTTVSWINFNLENDNHAQLIYEYYDAEHGWTTTKYRTVDYASAECLNMGCPYVKEWLVPTWETAVIEDELSEDLMFIDRWDVSSAENSEAVPLLGTQDIYLRCDAGNPAEVYHTIIMSMAVMNGGNAGHCFDTWGNNNLVFDNIAVIGTINNFMETCEDVVIRDCEFGYVGGNVKGMWIDNNGQFDYIHVHNYGDGLYNMESAVQIRNNYLHHCTHVALGGEKYGEYNHWDTGYGMIDGVPVRRSSEFCDNVVMYAGVGFGNQTSFEIEFAMNTEESPNEAVVRETISVHDNIFAYMGYDVMQGDDKDFYCWSLFDLDTEGQVKADQVYQALAGSLCFDNNICIKGYHGICSMPENALTFMQSMTGNKYYGDPEDVVWLNLTTWKVLMFWQMIEEPQS